jgi:hypothetical protein
LINSAGYRPGVGVQEQQDVPQRAGRSRVLLAGSSHLAHKDSTTGPFRMSHRTVVAASVNDHDLISARLAHPLDRMGDPLLLIQSWNNDGD